MTLRFIIPAYINDPARPETPAERRRTIHTEWAADELRRHDAAVTRCWHRQWAALTEAMAETGCDDERKVAADYLHDMLSDVFDTQRGDLMKILDDEGGDVTRHPCPITSLHKEATA